MFDTIIDSTAEATQTVCHWCCESPSDARFAGRCATCEMLRQLQRLPIAYAIRKIQDAPTAAVARRVLANYIDDLKCVYDDTVLA